MAQQQAQQQIVREMVHDERGLVSLRGALISGRMQGARIQCENVDLLPIETLDHHCGELADTVQAAKVERQRLRHVRGSAASAEQKARFAERGDQHG
jgi:predicted kinase